MKIRFAISVLTVVTALSACNGWPDTYEAEEAENRPEKYPTYAATPAEHTPTINFENRPWMVSATPENLRGAKLQPVGTAGTTSLYAQQGDVAPYGVLFAPAGGTMWKRVLPVE